jgi:branched-chain amino acid transport system permease protein
VGPRASPAFPAPPFPGINLRNNYFYYYLELIVFAIALAFGLFIVHTPLGRKMRAMRDDSLAAGAVGVEVPQLRMTAFFLSSVYGGVAGVLYAGLIRYVAPETFSLANMFLLLAMVIIGGRQSLVGCVVGAIALSVLREVLVDYPSYAQVAYGSVVVLTVVFAPTGLAGLPRRIAALLRRLGWLPAHSGAALKLGPFRPYPSSPSRDPGRGVAGRGREHALPRAQGPAGHHPDRPRGRDPRHRRAQRLGKTTLFNVVSGLYRATSGRVFLGDKDVTTASSHRLARSGIARTFQNLRLFKALSVRENILVALDQTAGAQAAGATCCGRPACSGTTARCGARPTSCSSATG